MGAAIRCGITFETADEFRAAIVVRGPSIFVPFPDEVADGESLEVDVTIGEARVAVKGEVIAPDFDEVGNVGLNVKLDEASWKAVNELDRELREGRSGTALFASTRIVATPAPLPPEPLPTPGDEAPEILEPGTLIDGRFRIEKHLATGGMGEVYRAEHVLLKRPVALKLLRRALSSDADMWGRFQREAQLVSRLENPHIVRVFDFGKTPDGQLFLAMEYVEGDTLAQRLEKGPLTPAAAVEILAQVLDGLHEAHVLGVVHRDLKPPNIILGHRREGGERAKILDFGIARLADSLAPQESRQLTQLGVVVGTPAYLAPEQALADEVDHRTDIYAMGCVAYELLTGKPPFVAQELRKIISMHLTSAPVDPAKVRPELAAHPQLCAAVLKALAKERENRFQSVLDFSEALRKSLEVPGKPETPLEQLVPVPSAPWPPAEVKQPAPPPAPPPVGDWQPMVPTATPAPQAPPAEAAAAADDFFVSVGSGVFIGPQGGAAAPVTKPATESGDGAFVRIEVLGVSPSSPAGQACSARVKALVQAAGGFLAAQDEEGLLFGFVGKGGRPGGRVTKAMHAARDAVTAEAGKLGAQATLRAFAGQTEFPLPAGFSDKVRRQLASARANTLWLEQRLSGFAARQCELASTGTPGLVACGPPKRRARSAPELLGRASILEALERRLASLTQGVGAPVVVKGPAGSGLSSLANALVTGARKRGAFALSTTGLSEPYGALVELLCQAVGVHPATRHTALAPALEKLPVVEPARLAALWLAGVRPLPQPLTPGQAAHALRVVVRAVAGERLMVLALDGLHEMDEGSVEAFLSMAQRPASRELLVGLSASSPFDAKLAELQAIAVPPLSQAEVQRLVCVATGGIAGPALAHYVFDHSVGVPGTALQLVGWLEDAGFLIDVTGNVVELSEPEVEAPKSSARAAVEAMPPELRQTLQAAALLGSRFELSVLQAVFPGATQAALAALMAQGWLTVDGPRRMRFGSRSSKAAVPELGGSEAKAAHLRAAAQLIALGTADATAVEPMALAGHLTVAGDGARGLPVWKHALELAIGRRDARTASRAWAGVAAAIGLMPASEGQARGQLEALTRAASQALVMDDVTRARGLIDAAGKLAAAVPSAEYLLVEARVLRAEGRRVKAAEVLAQAEQLAGGSRLVALVLAERGEAREVEGDLEGSSQALQQALKLAPEAAELARLHGEVDLGARLEARLATIAFARRDVGKALALLESSLGRWRVTAWPFAEARVLSTMGTVLAYQQRFVEAAAAYQAAAQAGTRSGDYKFQARALLQQAKALRRQQGDSAQMKSIASEARKLALVVGWEEGRVDASALLGQ